MRRSRVRAVPARVVLAFGLLAAGLALPPSSQGGELGQIHTLSPPMTSAREPRIAVDEDGDAVAMFFYGDDTIGPGPPAYCKLDDFGEETDDCTAAVRSWSGGAWSGLQDLSLRFSGRLGRGAVALDGQGRAFTIWGGTSEWGGLGGVVVRARSAAGSWSAGEVLSPDPHDPQLDVDDEGDAVAVWLHPVTVGFIVNYQVRARARTANGTLSATQDISPAGAAAWSPQVAVEGDGDALIVWQAQITPGSGVWTVQARARAADGTLSPVQNLSAPGVDAWEPRVEIDADGDALVVWQIGLGGGIQARARQSDGTLLPVVTLSPAGRRGDSPELDMVDDGRAVVAWSGYDANWNSLVRVRVRSAAGAWSAMETVSLPASLGEVFDPAVAMDRDGRTLLVWAQASGGSLYQPLQARTRSPAGRWSNVRNVSDSRAWTWDTRVDMSPRGQAVVLWSELFSSTDDHEWGPAIMATAFSADELPPDLSPPQSTITAGPRGAIARRNATFRFRSSELGSTFRCRMDASAWRSCSSPKLYRGLGFRRHVFRVRAVDPSGNADPTPATRAFRVVRG
jgi:hypothetical protein